MPLDLYDEVGRVAAALREGGIDYALVGGVALAIHGAPRATKDIDLLIVPSDRDRALQALEKTGFRFPAILMKFKKSGIRVQRVTKVDGEEHMMLDLLLADPPLEEIWTTRTTVETERGPLRVVSREALARMKAMSGRPHDLADLERLQEMEDAGEA